MNIKNASLLFLILIIAGFFFIFSNNDKNPFRDLNNFGGVANSCESDKGEWLDEYQECELMDKVWCEEHHGNFSECESGCRHSDNPLTPCTLQCIGVCRFNGIENSN